MARRKQFARRAQPRETGANDHDVGVELALCRTAISGLRGADRAAVAAAGQQFAAERGGAGQHLTAGEVGDLRHAFAPEDQPTRSTPTAERKGVAWGKGVY